MPQADGGLLQLPRRAQRPQGLPRSSRHPATGECCPSSRQPRPVLQDFFQQTCMLFTFFWACFLRPGWGLAVEVLGCRASQVVLVVNIPPANAGDKRDGGSIPGLGSSPGGGHGNPLQYSCLENSMDRGARRATVPGVAQESDRTACMHSKVWMLPARVGQELLNDC